jgi:hypothetical protein
VQGEHGVIDQMHLRIQHGVRVLLLQDVAFAQTTRIVIGRGAFDIVVVCDLCVVRFRCCGCVHLHRRWARDTKI